MGSVKTFSRVSLVLKKSSMAAFSIPLTYMTTSTLLSMTAAVLLPSLLTGLLAALNVRSGLLAALSVHGKLVAALGVDSGLLEGPDSWLALQWWTWKTGQGSFAVCKLSSLTCTSENVEQRFSTIESMKKTKSRVN